MILGPRRHPPIPCPPSNTETSIAILTSIGFRQLSAEHYVEAIKKLKPDIAIGLADIVHGKPPGVKRRGKMVDRTHAFTRDALEQLYGLPEGEGEKSRAAYFAPVLPLDNVQQSLYLDDLETEFRDYLSGLALYESSSLIFIPEALGDLPRLLLSDPPSPHEILREISLGADLLTLPLIGSYSDAGIAFDFSFPTPSSSTESGAPRPLGINLWSPEYKTDVSPLREGCECYACRHHLRAYFHHLLAAKEMTAWALLSIHNHHVMDRFFAGVRDSIQRGTFDADVQTFNRAYVSGLPAPTGQGPRYGFDTPFENVLQLANMDTDCAGISSLRQAPFNPGACHGCMGDWTMFRRNLANRDPHSRRQIPTLTDWRSMDLLRKHEWHIEPFTRSGYRDNRDTPWKLGVFGLPCLEQASLPGAGTLASGH